VLVADRHLVLATAVCYYESMRYLIIVALLAAGCDAPFTPSKLPQSLPPVPAPPESPCFVISQGRYMEVPCPTDQGLAR
jgi:hypothetical protein